MTSAGTCQDRSQPASASTSRLVVPNVRVSCIRRDRRSSGGTRIVASICALPMSMPHTRSRYSGSSVTSSTAISSVPPKTSTLRSGTARGPEG
jgi:hypothetical protein